MCLFFSNMEQRDMKLYFDFGLIQIINSAIILEHMPATEIEKLKRSLGDDFTRIGTAYENNLNAHAFDIALSKKFPNAAVADRNELNSALKIKKL